MKHIISILLVMLLCVSVAGCTEPDNPTIDVDTGSSQAPSSSSDDSSTDSSSEEENTIDFDSWEMLLINPWNSLPEDFNPELAEIDIKYAGYDGAQFDARAIDQLHAMCEAAANDGIRLVIISAYRTNATQSTLFNNKISRVKAANPALTDEEAENEAATVVARPGTSEHQVGLAVDFNSVQDSFRDTEEYKWLTENCTDYGFILRYADDKQDKTGIIPEPWHYRYVGVENAKAIKESGLSMEEFIEKYNK